MSMYTENGKPSYWSTAMSNNRIWLEETGDRVLLYLAFTEKKAWAAAAQ